MRRFPALLLARRNLRRNRVRTALAALGILIGVFAIASLGVFGNVLQLAATDALGGIGNQVLVTPDQDAGVESLTSRDIAAIRRAAAGRATVTPLYTGGAQVSGGDDRTFAQLYGTATPDVLFEAARGRLPERHRQGALVGEAVAESLDLRVGSTLLIEGQRFRVIAVLASPDTITPVRPENAVVLPPDAFAGEVDQVVVQARSGGAASAVADDVRAALNPRQQRVNVVEFGEIVARIDEFFGLLSGFLVALGAVSLVVAGVSILNVMLMSTVERRGEIGVLRAVGVQRNQVLRMLLVEAVLLGVAGGVGGVLASLATVAGLYLATPLEASVVLAPSNAVFPLLGFAVGVAVSLVSGLYPAWKAASLHPVRALRGG